ncbi:MAG: hypothetical protein DDT38_00584 [Firmicutes bacterium]|nr:hypothetical protein [candidate division NPL-UPA2 bacterium]
MTKAPADFRYGQPPQSKRDAADYVPNLNTLVPARSSEMREVVERFALDREALLRFYDVPRSHLQLSRLKSFYRAWQKSLEEIAYDDLSVGGRIDWHLLKSKIKYLLALVERDEKNNSEIADLLPIIEDVATLQANRRQFEPLDASVTAATLTEMHRKLTKTTAESAEAGTAKRSVAQRAANRIADLKNVLDDWFKFYDGYDPYFSWWNRTPYASLITALDNYHRFLRETLVGAKPGEDEPIIGDPIGREGLAVDLEHEMIPYTPSELINTAEQELAWCMEEWRRAARDMGLGTNWKAALSRTMNDHLAPGQQPLLIASQAYEAVDYITKRDLLTVPPLAIDIWRMAMMTPEAQKTNPFFLGGEQIRVSFPTDSMGHNDKVSSLRANNIHLARATVQHELIPGHHLQMFSRERFNPHRKAFDTPFWIEGWALWWEFLLWDLGFPVTPENRAGMLFWRTHRSARIIFSLKFHIGEWSPEECIEFLVETVGHDRHTATGEVRRSFNGNYPPLYQAAYMIGAIQIRALHRELVAAGRMTLKEFHDSIIAGNLMPIEMVRANLSGTLLPRDYQTNWKFCGESP